MQATGDQPVIAGHDDHARVCSVLGGHFGQSFGDSPGDRSSTVAGRVKSSHTRSQDLIWRVGRIGEWVRAYRPDLLAWPVRSHFASGRSQYNFGEVLGQRSGLRASVDVGCPLRGCYRLFVSNAADYYVQSVGWRRAIGQVAVEALGHSGRRSVI